MRILYGYSTQKRVIVNNTIDGIQQAIFVDVAISDRVMLLGAIFFGLAEVDLFNSTYSKI